MDVAIVGIYEKKSQLYTILCQNRQYCWYWNSLFVVPERQRFQTYANECTETSTTFKSHLLKVFGCLYVRSPALVFSMLQLIAFAFNGNQKFDASLCVLEKCFFSHTCHVFDHCWFSNQFFVCFHFPLLHLFC